MLLLRFQGIFQTQAQYIFLNDRQQQQKSLRCLFKGSSSHSVSLKKAGGQYWPHFGFFAFTLGICRTSCPLSPKNTVHMC